MGYYLKGDDVGVMEVVPSAQRPVVPHTNTRCGTALWQLLPSSLRQPEDKVTSCQHKVSSLTVADWTKHTNLWQLGTFLWFYRELISALLLFAPLCQELSENLQRSGLKGREKMRNSASFSILFLCYSVSDLLHCRESSESLRQSVIQLL